MKRAPAALWVGSSCGQMLKRPTEPARQAARGGVPLELEAPPDEEEDEAEDDPSAETPLEPPPEEPPEETSAELDV